jgi:signal transduction histidine kinase
MLLMAETKSRLLMAPSTTSDETAPLDTMLELAAARDVDALLAQALGLLIGTFKAEAGSILVQARMLQRQRAGDFPPQSLPVVDRWEAAIERRLQKAMWCIPATDRIPVSVNHLPTDNHILVNTPVLRGTRVVGAISLILPSSRPFRLPQRQQVGRFGRGIGALVSMATDLSLAQQRLNRLGLFYQVGQALVTTFDLNEFLTNTMQLATDVLDAAASALMLIDETKGDLVFEISHGGGGDILRRQRISIHEGVAGWVARQGKPTITNDARSDPRFNSRVDVRTGFLTRSIAAVPLKIKGRTIGVLEVLNKFSGGGFDAEDLRLLTSIGAQAAIAIENARLYAGLRAERDHIIQAQEDVRRELARNLHDGTVQMLSAISMSIDHLQRLLEVNPQAAMSELGALRSLVHQAAREARVVLFELRPIILETQGLVPTLESYVSQLNDTEDLKLHFEPAPLPRQFDTKIAGTIFSIVQEAVNNAKRHAAAQNLWIKLAIAPEDDFVIQVRDDGRGFDVASVTENYEKRGSFGMLNMRERARLIDGDLSIESRTQAPERGTTVTLHVPLPGTEARETRSIIRGTGRSGDDYDEE